VWGHEVPVYSHFFKARLRTENAGDKRWPSEIDTVEMVALWYMVEVDGVRMDRPKLQEMELQLFELGKTGNFSSKFSFCMYGDEVRGVVWLQT